MPGADQPAVAVTYGDSAQFVYSLVRERIATGQYDPTTTLTESVLAEESGVSRTPVRAALHRLATEGIVKVTPGRRVRIAASRGEEVAHIYALRIFMEMVAVRITVPQLNPGDHEALRSCMDKMTFFENLHDYSAWQPIHESFHEILVGKAPRLWTSVAADLLKRADPYRKIYTTEIPGGWKAGMQDHKEILSAALLFDAKSAGEAIVRHYGKVGQLTLAVVDQLGAGDPGSVLRESVSLLLSQNGHERDSHD